MQVIVDCAKRRWHRDVVSHPSIHAWVLNLYRAGERYPQTVTDYFPVQHAPDATLAADLARHRHDEERHTQMYAAAIRAMGEEVWSDAADVDVFNAVIRSHTEATFTIEEADGAEVKRLKVAHFLAHAHFLEKRIARSLEYHRDACERAGAAAAERVVAAVLSDEERHVSYTRAAARELLTQSERGPLFDEHRRAERRANLDFSRMHVRQFTQRFLPLVPRDRGPFYRLCAFLMEEAMEHV